MSEPKPYWFPAKRYGWGWGLPITWQGWFVLTVFLLLLLLGVFLFPPHRHAVAFIAYTGFVSAALVAICYVKGEPPGWRWGDK
ncbi:MAG: hypothetical protein KGL70_02295 [Betaproteobacteria bacterium]|nr:hypothetical protein [Betaproteobacteria bacterium]MDE2003646.1 hypothetical protein [Betaproteobacteria bacterium]MDE2210223.1 hypothetical protein [Betaproteobacteria bacterium]MDE2358197.1 hypothetical protein [Betaproteobacteria bacterium]